MVRVGILIIGSLLWDDQRRETWRQSRLLLGQKVAVQLPIRYGRRSQSRCNTFTMTLAPGDQEGQAWLVPCREAIDGVDALVKEAMALWQAESGNAQRICADWGCTGALFHPKAVLDDLRSGWAARFSKEACTPIAPVRNDGTLGIPWPRVVYDEAAVGVDVILATVTKAEAKRPNVEDIADAWLGQKRGHERYFFENVQHGIRTPDDGFIWRRVEEQKPRWLTNKTYARAVAILRGEAAPEK